MAAFELALAQRKPAVMAKVAMDIAKLHGLVVQRRDIAPSDPNKMTAAELQADSDLLDERIRLAEERVATLKAEEPEPAVQ